MNKQKSTFSYLLLITMGLVGAWLVGLFEGEKPIGDVSGGSLLLSVLGFFMFLGAIVGIIIVISRNRRPMNQVQKTFWNQTRRLGKRHYVLNYVLRCSLLALASISFIVLKNYWAGKSVTDELGIYAVIFLLYIGGGCYAAIRTWSYFEWEYHNALQSTPQHNNSFNPSPR